MTQGEEGAADVCVSHLSRVQNDSQKNGESLAQELDGLDKTSRCFPAASTEEAITTPWVIS